MYTREVRMKAIEAYVAHDLNAALTVADISYPSAPQLRAWYRDAISGVASKSAGPKLAMGEEVASRGYSQTQIAQAIAHYFATGECLAHTMRELGYPADDGALARWIDKAEPGRRMLKGTTKRKYDDDFKAEVITAVKSGMTATEAQERFGVSRDTIRWWIPTVGGLGAEMRKKNDSGGNAAHDDIDEMQAKLAELRRQVRELELERDVLSETIDILGKGLGTDPKRLTNAEKAELVDRLRGKWGLSVVLAAVALPRSSYQYRVEAGRKPDKYADLRIRISEIFEASERRYGYRRIHGELAREGVCVSEKVVSRLMGEEGLIAKGRKRRRRYSSYAGEISAAPPNLVNRDFHADAPNRLWLTDITEFSLPAGKVYLSPVIDCFDGLVVSWTASTSPNSELANTMLKGAIETLAEGEFPIIHSDRGCHYRWPGWISICENSGLTRSMSKKGCSPDNSAMEGFFGRMKNEMFYGEDWSEFTIEGFMSEIGDYMTWCNNERIKVSLGDLSPMEYRLSKSLIAA